MDLVRTLGVAIDASKAEQGGNKASSAFAGVGKAARESEKAVDGAGKAIHRTGEGMKNSSRAGDVLRETLNRQNAVLGQLTLATERMVTALNRNRSGLDGVAASSVRASAAQTGLSSVARQTGEAMRSQTGACMETAMALVRVAQAATVANTQLRALQSAGAGGFGGGMGGGLVPSPRGQIVPAQSAQIIPYGSGAAAAREMKFVGSGSTDAAAGLQRVNMTGSKTGSVFSQLAAGARGAAGALMSFRGGLAAAVAVLSARELINTEVQVQKTANALRYASGTAEEYAKNARFVRNVSGELGLELSSTAAEFAKLAASAKGTSLEGDGIRNLFVATAKAATALGLSSAETGGALNAFSQMLSKGTVQAEELRGQLGERLYGAFNLAAKGMGVTTQELNKMLERGEVTANQMLPALTREMDKAFGKDAQKAAGSLQAEINRLSTAWTDFQTSLLATGLGDLLKNLVTGAKDLLRIFTALNEKQKDIDQYAAKAVRRWTPDWVPEWARTDTPVSDVLSGGLRGGLRAMSRGVGAAADALNPRDPTAAGALTLVNAPQTNRQFADGLDEAMGFSRGSVMRRNRQQTGNLWGMSIGGEDVTIRPTVQEPHWTDGDRARVQQDFQNTMQPFQVARPFDDGLTKAIKELPNEFQRIKNIGEGTAKSLEDNFSRFTDMMVEAPDQIGKAFRQMTAGILQDIAKLTLRQSVVSPLVGALSTAIMGIFGGTMAGGAGGNFSNGGSALASIKHTGGIVGVTPSTMRPVDPALFHNAPRFHQGLAPDEFPAILQRGEAVIPKNQVGRGGPSITNNFNVTVDGSKGGSSDQNERLGREIAQQIEAMMDQRLARAMQPRGMLYQAYST
jgi:tape measure domain-containing protein